MEVDSEHPLPNQYRHSIEVLAPEATQRFRLRFRWISLEEGYDYVVIQDSWGNELERITGFHQRYLSRSIPGNRANVVVETDAGVRSWGFQIDEIRYRSCEQRAPLAMPLARAGTCNELKDAIVRLAVEEVRQRFSHRYSSMRSFDGEPMPVLLEGQQGSDPSAGVDHSETNLQVEGVDEADIVKTDGFFTYVVAGRQLRVFATWPAEATELVHSIDLEGFPKELFLDNGKVVVLAGVHAGGSAVGPGPGPYLRLSPHWWNPEAFTKITVFDMSGREPVVHSETLLAGQYNTARRVGDVFRLVLRRQLQWPTLRYYPVDVQGPSRAFDDALEQLEEDAIRAIATRALADWLPESYRLDNGIRTPIPVDCSDFWVPTGPETLGLMSVVTVNLAGERPAVQETSLLLNGGQVYQSRENLYVTTEHRRSCWHQAAMMAGQFTYVHKLSVADPLRAPYLATGGFPGRIDDPFSLDEHNGFLRVATTNNRWNIQEPERSSENQVFVLEQVRDELVIAGQTPVMAPGERIFSCRFVGDRGFVVTYRRIDPLFTLDLSDPRSPTVVGELKIPGFSTYLHPLDEHHLFAIGNDFDEDGTTRNGLALTIFDVSNMSSPRMIHKALVGTTRGHSEALYNHKAFTLYRQPRSSTAVLAIPFFDWIRTDAPETIWGQFRSSLKVFRVSPLGILGLGEIDHSNLFASNDSDRFGWWYRPHIRRGLFVEDYAYAISDAGLRVAHLGDLSVSVAEVGVAPQYDDPTLPPPVVTGQASAEPGVQIPDSDWHGVTSDLVIQEGMTVSSLRVGITIEHSYRGDLVVTVEHNGVVETLSNRAGGQAQDLNSEFGTERFLGMNAQGTWTVRVSDRAYFDVGTLVAWRVVATGIAAEPLDPGSKVEVERSSSNLTPMGIPDNDRDGISSQIEILESLTIKALTVTVDITHSYVGDLLVALEHDGLFVTLHEQQGGPANHLRRTYEVGTLVDKNARGTWQLHIMDLAPMDQGILNSWRMDMLGEQT